MNNLKLFRELSGAERTHLAKLINKTTHTYLYYESGRIQCPTVCGLMVAKIYDIDVYEIFCPEKEISSKTKEKLKSYAKMDENERKKAFEFNLFESKEKKVSYRNIQKIKEAIINIYCFKKQ